ncbi:MAG: phosphate acyltransferase PlsX [Verrucomicrobia bacterium]|jgi:glycerol-3-phosphate acyltransferase PlsX|nr:phosphate acyltransferase PlsX [Verrucomicrobiota bacterium]
MRIAVDVMGGDHGCEVVIAGVKQAIQSETGLTRVLLVGRQADIEATCQRAGLADARVEIVHASEVLGMEDKPLESIRKKKDSSLVRAIELVRSGQADAVISPGNTGALVAGSMKLGRLPGVERPALACRMPSRTGDFVLLDAGANAVAEPLHLAQFAVMGNLYAREILHHPQPRVGILSNGSEQTKGDELTREAARLCTRLNLNFIGYVEGFDLFDDSVDVVVTDGFTGNVVLKTAESLGNTIGHILKRELRANPLRKLGGLLARGAFRGLRQRLDPEVYGGAVLLGLEGVVIKAHGSSRERAIANAIRVAAEEIRHNLNHVLSRELDQLRAALAAPAAPVTPVNA